VRSGLGGAKSSSYQQMPVSIQNGPRLRRRCLRRRQGKRLVEQKSAAVTRLSEISGRRAFERASVPETLGGGHQGQSGSADGVAAFARPHRAALFTDGSCSPLSEYGRRDARFAGTRSKRLSMEPRPCAAESGHGRSPMDACLSRDPGCRGVRRVLVAHAAADHRIRMESPAHDLITQFGTATSLCTAGTRLGSRGTDIYLQQRGCEEARSDAHAHRVWR
jgi:hypothetical protein